MSVSPQIQDRTVPLAPELDGLPPVLSRVYRSRGVTSQAELELQLK